MSAANDQIIYDIAIKNGFTPTAAKLVVAQARFESADYTSNVFKVNNNTSGMKFIGQPLATRGSLVPVAERSASCKSGGTCVNGDYYAKFQSVKDSAKDKIERLYTKTIKGITPEQLKNVQTPEEFAKLLKIRGYYQDKESNYAAGLARKLTLINITEFVKNNKNYLSLGIILVAVGLVYFYHIK